MVRYTLQTLPDGSRGVAFRRDANRTFTITDPARLGDTAFWRELRQYELLAETSTWYHSVQSFSKELDALDPQEPDPINYRRLVKTGLFKKKMVWKQDRAAYAAAKAARPENLRRARELGKDPLSYRRASNALRDLSTELLDMSFSMRKILPSRDRYHTHIWAIVLAMKYYQIPFAEAEARGVSTNYLYDAPNVFTDCPRYQPETQAQLEALLARCRQKLDDPSVPDQEDAVQELLEAGMKFKAEVQAFLDANGHLFDQSALPLDPDAPIRVEKVPESKADPLPKQPEGAAPKSNTQSKQPVASVARQPAAAPGSIDPALYGTVGSVVPFGNYGGQPIQWIVVESDIKNNRVLLLSRDVIDSKPFHVWKEEVSWESCSLRRWLNRTFYQEAFSAEERKMIIGYKDSVFLLTRRRLLRYFRSDKALSCGYTPYAAANGLITDRDKARAWWLPTVMRKIGARYDDRLDVEQENLFDSELGVSQYAYVVFSSGASEGNDVELAGRGVRPAIWLCFSSISHSDYCSSERALRADAEERAELANQARRQAYLDAFSRRGNIVTFGDYPCRSQHWENGLSMLEWIVLDVQDGRALLLSRYAIMGGVLGCETPSDWENNSFRKKLEWFYRSSFTNKERSAILLTEVDNSSSQNAGYEKGKKSSWNTFSSAPTKDHVFLLSYAEAMHYFPSAKDRLCKGTEAMRESYRHNSIFAEKDGEWGWLRSMNGEGYALHITPSGNVFWEKKMEGLHLLRPAMWVDLSKL